MTFPFPEGNLEYLTNIPGYGKKYLYKNIEDLYYKLIQTSKLGLSSLLNLFKH